MTENLFTIPKPWDFERSDRETTREEVKQRLLEKNKPSKDFVDAALGGVDAFFKVLDKPTSGTAIMSSSVGIMFADIFRNKGEFLESFHTVYAEVLHVTKETYVLNLIPTWIAYCITVTTAVAVAYGVGKSVSNQAEKQSDIREAVETLMRTEYRPER